MSPASRGLAPREGLECLLAKMGRTGPLVEPRRGPQAGKSGGPRSQDADSRPAGLGVVAPIWKPLPDASGLLACACLFITKEETRTLRALAPAWRQSSWLMS